MQLDLLTRSKILHLVEEGKTQREISKKLGVSQSTVSRTVKKYYETGSLDHAGGNGRKRSLEASDTGALLKIIKKTPKISLRKVSEELFEAKKTQVSHVTVKNKLNSENIFAFSSIKKPFLSKKNIDTRKVLSQEFLFLSDEEVEKIIFSDESKFNLFYSDGKVSVWREPKKGLALKNLTPTVKHGGGSVMVWGCFSYRGVGKLVFIDGIMNATSYVDILSNNLPESARLMGLDEYTFMQDNDPKHTSKIAKAYFEYKEIDLLPWPPQSPDLNPIETLWAIIKQKLYKLKPKNKDELKAYIQKEWDSISVETCQKLALSFKKRALAVYKAQGLHTKY